MAIARPARLLKNRHGVYCFRWIVPTRLRDDAGHPREVRVSLGTRDPKLARVLGLQINLTCEGLPLATKPQDLRRLVEQLKQRAAQSDNFTLAASEPAFDQTSLASVTPLPAAHQAVAARLSAVETSAPQQRPEAAKSIRTFVADYLASRAGLARNRDSTTEEKGRTLECLLCFLRRSKQVDIDRVGIDAIRRSWLIDFVSFYAKYGAVPNDEAWNHVVERQTAQVPSKGGRPAKGALAARTVIKAIGHLSELGTYGTATEALTANPIDVEFRAALKGLWDDAAAARRHSGYRPFNAAQLKAIFDPEQLLAYCSAADYFWSALLGLFTVARLSEIVTLSLDDVFTDPTSGVLVLRIRNDPNSGRRVKNHNSERLVPVCQRLLDLGFGTYIDHVRALGAKVLFPHLKPGATRAVDPSKAQSRQFAKYLDHLGIVDEQLVFHSFRHTGITTMHARGVPLMDSELIAGHAAQALAQSTGSPGRSLQGWGATQTGTYIHVQAFEEAGEPLLKRLHRHMDTALAFDLDYDGLRAAAEIVRENTIATRGADGKCTFSSGWHTNAKAYAERMRERLRDAMRSSGALS